MPLGYIYIITWCIWDSVALEATFITRVKVVRERMLERDEEIRGQWLTEAKMETKPEFPKCLVSMPVDACKHAFLKPIYKRL